MLQWTGGSRRKVAASRKSTHSRQKQYFEQRKRQRQAPGQVNSANGIDKQALCNAESRSLDILNLINFAVASQSASTELVDSVNSSVVKISDDSLLGKVTDNYQTVVETRSEHVTNSSVSNLPQVSQIDSYKYAGHANKCKMPASIPEHTSSWEDDRSNEKKEKHHIEATFLDLLGDDGPHSNIRRSVPETYVALSVEGLGKVGSQTPVHSPKMQNRFFCKGISLASKSSRQARSTSALESTDNDGNEELNAMIDDFRVSPLCNNGSTWDYTTKTTCNPRVAPVPPYFHEDQVENISIKGKGFDSCLLASNEKHAKDSFGYLEKQFIEESYDVAPHNKKFSFVGYPFLNSTSKKFEENEASDVGVRDTFLGSSRSLWDGAEIYEASATAAPDFRHSTPQKEVSPSFIWESDDTIGDGMFKPPNWSFLSTEDSQDNTSILSEDLNSCTAASKKKNLNFGTRSMKLRENKRNSGDKFEMYSGGRNFMGIFSQDENIFTGFDDAIWGKKQKINPAFGKADVENIFLPSDNPFNSFTMKSPKSPCYEAKFKDDHFDLFSTPRFNINAVASECEPTDFINQNEMVRNKAFEFNSQIPMKPSTKAKSLGQYSSSGEDFFEEIHFAQLPKNQEYNEDRGSSGKPQPKDYEKRPTSSGNAESVAGPETLSKVTEHEESKSEIPEPFDRHRVENSNEQPEVVSTEMEELPTQIQKYIHGKLNQCRGHSPIPSQPSNEESKPTFEPESKEVHSACGGSSDASYQVMLQSYVLQLLCVQKVLLEASGKDIKKKPRLNGEMERA